MEGYIEITGCDLTKFVKEVYALSRPQGMGFIHYKNEPLSDEDAGEILKRGKNIAMDYVNGRSCKMYVRKEENGTLWINDRWYDHSEQDLSELLDRIGIKSKAA